MPILSDFSYRVPKELIARSPANPRDTSRLLVLNRDTGHMQHQHFYDLPYLLKPGTVLVRNNTKVIPARIFGFKVVTGGQVELLLIKRARATEIGEVWECLTKPSIVIGQRLTFPDCKLTAECLAHDGYIRVMQFNQSGPELFASLEKIGHTPLPPYIDWTPHDETALRELYQTTYAKFKGSAAAPTAGLHFTPELDEKLQAAGVIIEEITLHVGLGTFLPVKTSDITKHRMHYESYELKAEVAERLNVAKAAGQTIISVGTTTTRVLESCSDADGRLHAGSGETNIFIYPPYQFKFIDGLITNFHESESTLLMLVSALVSAPNTEHEFKTFVESSIGQAYQTAIDEKYRLHSFGDAMLIW